MCFALGAFVWGGTASCDRGAVQSVRESGGFCVPERSANPRPGAQHERPIVTVSSKAQFGVHPLGCHGVIGVMLGTEQPKGWTPNMAFAQREVSLCFITG